MKRRRDKVRYSGSGWRPGRHELESCHPEGGGWFRLISGGGVGRGSLSILQSKSSEGARSDYESKSQHVGCL